MSTLRRTLSSFSYFLINTVAWLLIIILYGPPLLLISIWRYFINFIAVKLHSDYIPSTPNDTLLVHDTADKQPVVTGGFILKVNGHIDTAKLSTLFEELFLSPEYSENYVNLYCDVVKWAGYLFKRKIVSKVKLANHFQVKQLENEEDFKEILASWFQQKFQKGLPLWQIIVLNPVGVQEEGEELRSSFFAFKAHHVLMDGYSFVHVLDKLTGVTSPTEWHTTNNNDDVKCSSSPSPPPKENKTFWEEFKIIFSIPTVVGSFTFPNVSWKLYSKENKFPRCKSLRKFEMLPLACVTVALEPLKEIRRSLAVHFPSIIYGLQVGAIRQALLDDSHCSGKVFNGENDLPASLLITTSLPIIGREHPRNKFTNHWSGGYIKLPLRLSSPKERILQGNSSLEKVLKDDGTYIIWKYMSWLLWLFPCWFHSLLESSKLEGLQLFKYRASVSCIPQNCSVQYNLMGLPVQNIYHCPLMKDTFTSAVLLGCSSSHNDQVDFSLFGHPDWFGSQSQMNKVAQQYFRKELELLANECDINLAKLQFRS